MHDRVLILLEQVIAHLDAHEMRIAAIHAVQAYELVADDGASAPLGSTGRGAERLSLGRSPYGGLPRRPDADLSSAALRGADRQFALRRHRHRYRCALRQPHNERPV